MLVWAINEGACSAGASISVWGGAPFTSCSYSAIELNGTTQCLELICPWIQRNKAVRLSPLATRDSLTHTISQRKELGKNSDIRPSVSLSQSETSGHHQMLNNRVHFSCFQSACPRYFHCLQSTLLLPYPDDPSREVSTCLTDFLVHLLSCSLSSSTACFFLVRKYGTVKGSRSLVDLIFLY